MNYRYPCTGYLTMNGFGSWLEQECTTPRRNINLFAQELGQQFDAPWISLVNSGSSANLVAALALAEKVREQGKPLTAAISAFTFPTTVSALLLAGFTLTVVDTEPGGFNIDPNALQNLTPLPSVLAITHFLGFPCAIEQICALATEKGSYVLQDACETLGMKIKNRPIHHYGDLTTWSFYHPHHLSSYGGGAVLSLTEEDYILTDSVAHWGRACRCHIAPHKCLVPEGPAHQFTYERLGVNVEMSELNACFGRWQLQQWEQIEQARLIRYNLLYSTLQHVPTARTWKAPEVEASPFVFPIQLTDGRCLNDIFPQLKAEGIEIRTLMGGVCSEQAAFSHLQAALPNAQELARTTFFVGIHHTLPVEDVQHVASRLLYHLSTGHSGSEKNQP